MSSAIEWTDVTWNPVVGCTPVSPGCLNCYAARMARRQEAMGTPGYEPRFEPERKTMPDAFGTHTIAAKTIRIAEVVNGRAVFTGEVRTLPDRLTVPLHWRTPRMVFVNSMSDLFHEAVSFEFIDQVFAIMALCPQHTFQILTKRPERMAEYLAARTPKIEGHVLPPEWLHFLNDVKDERGRNLTTKYRGRIRKRPQWPLQNVWLGTSVEDQARADERIPWLLKCPAAVRFLSCEPLVGAIELKYHLSAALYRQVQKRYPSDESRTPEHLRYNGPPSPDWIIVGGESGPNSRVCNIDWIRGIKNQCQAAGVACFVKQMGVWPGVNPIDPAKNYTHTCCMDFTGKDVAIAGGSIKDGDLMAFPDGASVWRTCSREYVVGLRERVRFKDRKGGDPAEWPEDLRVREWPKGFVPAEKAKPSASGRTSGPMPCKEVKS